MKSFEFFEFGIESNLLVGLFDLFDFLEVCESNLLVEVLLLNEFLLIFVLFLNFLNDLVSFFFGNFLKV